MLVTVILAFAGCGKEPEKPEPAAAPQTGPVPQAVAEEDYARRSAERWAEQLDAIDRTPKAYAENVARLRDYIFQYEGFPQADEARRKLAEVETAWREDALRTFDTLKMAVDAAVAQGDYSALAQFDRIPPEFQSAASGEVRKKIEQEKAKHTNQALAAFAEATGKAGALLAQAKAAEARELLAPYTASPFAAVAARARELLEEIDRRLELASADSYETIAPTVFGMAAGRQYDLAQQAIENHLRAHPSPSPPKELVRDRTMLRCLRLAWDAYRKVVAGLRAGDRITLRDAYGNPSRTGVIEIVNDNVLTMRSGEGADARTWTFEWNLLPSTEIVRLIREQTGGKLPAETLAGCAALLCIDELTSPDGGIEMARELIEAARKTGQAIEYYREILEKRAKEPSEMKARYMLKGARLLKERGEWARCRAKCIAMKAKLHSTDVVRDYAGELDRMIEESFKEEAKTRREVLEIPLTAWNRSPYPRREEGVSAGVPFPQGMLTDAGLRRLAVFDEAGAKVPAQFTITNRWWRERDRSENPVDPPSIQWVLVDLMPTVPVNARTQYVLKMDSEPWEGDATLRVEKGANKVTVVTGPLKFTVKGSGFNLFDEVWLDESGRGDLGDANRIVAPHEGGFFVFSSFSGLGKNKFYSSGRCADGKVVVEEEGPLKVVVRASGRHVAADDLPGPGHLLDYEVWIKAYRGSPFVSVEYVFICRQGSSMEDGFPIDGVYVELPLTLAGGLQYTLGKPGGTVRGALAAEQSAWAEAVGSDRCAFGGAAAAVGEVPTKSGLPMELRWFYDQTSGQPLPGKDYPRPPSPENLGFVDLSDGRRGVTAGIAYFWQTWPKGVEAAGSGTLRLHVWSNIERKVRTVPVNYDQRFETLHSDAVPLRGNLFPGVAKSTKMGFYFHGKPDEQKVLAAWGAISRPVRVLCPTSWYCEQTRVFGYLASSNPENYDPEVYKDVVEMDHVVAETLLWIRRFRAKYYDPKNEQMDSYGCFNFGDSINWLSDRSNPKRFAFRWDNNYYDSSHTMFQQFFRTGDLDILEQAIETDTHLADVDMTSWHVDAEMIGACRYSPSNDHIRRNGTELHECTVFAPPVYSWHRCNFDRWFLFGDRWAYEQNYRAADFVVRNSRKVNRYAMGIGHGDRSSGHAIKNASLGYLATGEKKFLEGAKRVWSPNRGRGSIQDGWQAGILVEGAWWYWQASGDPAALAHVVNRASRSTFGHTRLFAYGLAFRIQNDPIYMQLAYDSMVKVGQNKGVWGATGDFAMAARNGLHFPWFVSALPVEKQIPEVRVDNWE